MANFFKNRELSRIEYETLQQQALAAQQAVLGSADERAKQLFQNSRILSFDEFESQLRPRLAEYDPKARVLENSNAKIKTAMARSAYPDLSDEEIIKSGVVPQEHGVDLASEFSANPRTGQSLEEVINSTNAYQGRGYLHGTLGDTFMSTRGATTNGAFFSANELFAQDYASGRGVVYKAKPRLQKTFNYMDPRHVGELIDNLPENFVMDYTSAPYESYSAQSSLPSIGISDDNDWFGSKASPAEKIDNSKSLSMDEDDFWGDSGDNLSDQPKSKSQVLGSISTSGIDDDDIWGEGGGQSSQAAPKSSFDEYTDQKLAALEPSDRDKWEEAQRQRHYESGKANLKEKIMRGEYHPIEAAESEEALRGLGYDSVMMEEGGSFNFAAYNMAEEGEVPRGNIDFLEKRQPKVSSWSNRDSLHRKNHRQNHLLSVEEAMAKEGAVGDLAPITAQEIEENLGFMIPEGHRNPEMDWTRPNQFTPHDFLEQVSTFEDFSARNFLTNRALEKGGYEKRSQIEAKVAEVESKTVQKTAAVERTTLTAIRKALREGVASHGTKMGIAGIAAGLASGLPAFASAATVGAAATGQGSPGVAAGVVGGAAVLGAAAYGYSKLSGETKGKISSSIGKLTSKIPSLRVGGLETSAGFIESELELTTRGLAGGMSSVINDFGLNRRQLEGGGFINTRLGREWTADGPKGFVAPSGKGWARVDGKKELYESWEKHITGDKSPFGKLRNLAYKSLGGKNSSANRWLARMGGFSTLLPPGIALYFAAKDAKKGYEENGILGGVLGAVKGYATSAITNRIIGSALMNPIKGVAAAAVLGGVAYSAHKVFDVRTQGNVYMQSKKESTSWMRAPGLTIASSTVATMRQRAISAIENSKYSSMKSLGNEAYMITAPRSRYASNTMMGNTSPMMSY